MGYTIIQLAAYQVYTSVTTNKEQGNGLCCDVVKAMMSLATGIFFRSTAILCDHRHICGLSFTKMSMWHMAVFTDSWQCTRNWPRSSRHSSEHKPLPYRAHRSEVLLNPIHRCVGSETPLPPTAHRKAKDTLRANETE